MSAPEPARRKLLLLAEATLAALTVTAVLGLGRLFVDGSFLPQVILAAIAAHGAAVLCRRRRLGPGPTVGVAVLGAILLTTWFQLGETAVAGLVPTPTTLDQARFELSEAWRTFGEVVAPAPVLPGFVLACSIGAWIIAFAADTAAFRARAVVEAVVPATTLFVFGGALGTGDHRLAVSALFIGAALAHWLAQRSLVSASSPTWLSSEQGGGARSLLRLGAGLGAIGVLAAVSVGPNLPGASDRAVIPWRASDRDEPSKIHTVSPLVDLRTRLVDQADIEVFRVEADQRSYWRVTSLETFDGQEWTSDQEFEDADGRLGADGSNSEAGFELIEQQYTIIALDSIWLPAAYRAIDVEGIDAGYDSDSNSLLAEDESIVGLSYSVTSERPTMTAAQLEEVLPEAPAALARTYTALPAGFSSRVVDLAQGIAQGTSSQYARARALQDYFRSGEFTYDLSVPRGHSGDALERFLFDTRRGYCEQFAGAFAAMARAIGLPARVAVGFTPGERDAKTGEWVVRGFNGHAWPEVYLHGYGWVPFEPTPGRGAPGAEEWTGIEEQQASAEDPNVPTTVPQTTTTTAGDGATTTTAPRGLQDDISGSGEQDGAGSPWPGRLLVLLAIVVIGPLVWAGILAVLRFVRRRRRRAAAATPGERVLVAWEEVAEALGRAGTALEPWETPDEFARRAAGATGVDPRLLGGLAGLTTIVTYGPGDVPEATADQALEVAESLEKAADALVDRRERLRLLVDPRPLLPEREARVDVREPV